MEVESQLLLTALQPRQTIRVSLSISGTGGN